MDGKHSMPLSLASPGQTVELSEIRGGRRLRQRLADLGLNIGTSVRVIQNDHTGPLILAVKEDARLALGRGMAHHIRVLPTFQTTTQDTQNERKTKHEHHHRARRQSKRRQKHHL